MNTETPSRRSRLTLWLIAGIFIGSFLLANLLYLFRDSLAPERTVNNGVLLQPPVPLEFAPVALPGAPDFTPADLRGKWTLLTVAPAGCAADCRARLHAMEQAHLTLGKELHRVQRVVLYPRDAAPEAPGAGSGLRSVPLPPARLQALARRLPEGGEVICMVDPMGNLMMHYPAAADAAAVHEDLKRLLRYSSAG